MTGLLIPKIASRLLSYVVNLVLLYKQISNLKWRQKLFLPFIYLSIDSLTTIIAASLTVYHLTKMSLSKWLKIVTSLRSSTMLTTKLALIC